MPKKYVCVIAVTMSGEDYQRLKCKDKIRVLGFKDDRAIALLRRDLSIDEDSFSWILGSSFKVDDHRIRIIVVPFNEIPYLLN